MASRTVWERFWQEQRRHCGARTSADALAEAPHWPHGLSAWRLALTIPFHTTFSYLIQGVELWAHTRCGCFPVWFSILIWIWSKTFYSFLWELLCPSNVVMQTDWSSDPQKHWLLVRCATLGKNNEFPWSLVAKIGLIGSMWKLIIGDLCKLAS